MFKVIKNKFFELSNSVIFFTEKFSLGPGSAADGSTKGNEG